MTYAINTPRIENVNTYRIENADTQEWMTDTKADRLRLARERAGYRSASEAARAFGWTDSAYRHHENGTRSFGPDAAKKYGRAFRVKPSWLLGMSGDAAAPLELPVPADSELIIVGEVEAGVWREPVEKEPKWMLDSPAPVEGARRFGLLVNGYSMDEFYAPGTILDCISAFSEGIEPEDGDHVIVERIKPDGLRETTVKELVVKDGEYWLRARSSKPEFQDDIHIGSPREGHVGDDEIRVIGYVVSSINRSAWRVLLRMGKMRRLTNHPTVRNFLDT